MADKTHKPVKKNRPGSARQKDPVQGDLTASAPAPMANHQVSTAIAQSTAIHDKPDKGLPIIGIGSSAGGLEAVEQFFTHMPPDAGMAFVLVPHLDPAHASMMTDIVRRFTKMTVLEAEDGMEVEPDHVYVIPPNRNLAIFHKNLYLSLPSDSRGFRLPIDFFFRSLAEDHGEKAICIILSGTGADGTLGLRAINGAGGLSMVQEPASAQYDGMPQSAIKTGLADYVLPVQKMPEQLIAYVARFHLKEMRSATSPPEKTRSGMQKILMLLRSKTGHDFSLYKKNTIYRRIEKRMSVHQFEDTALYIRYLQDHPDEIKMLFKEFLIGVTNFFRNAEVFDILKAKILPKILYGKPDHYVLRVWTPGCATGEETYSIAMTVREYLDEQNANFKVQIFGTDINEEAIAGARMGLYPGNIALDINPGRLKRFFNKEDHEFRIKKEIREDIIFAVQNVIKDPPFTRLDLLSCRNLLIYLEPEMQSKLIPIFHYSMKPGGVLLLGPSESIGGFSDLFPMIDKKWKVYQRKEAKSPIDAFTLHAVAGIEERDLRKVRAEAKGSEGPSMSVVAQRVLLETFALPSVIVNREGVILYIHGRIGRYLELPPGEPKANVLQMARKGLRRELHAALISAASKKREAIFKGLKVMTDGGIQAVNLTIRPIQEIEQPQDLFLIVFENVPPIRKEATVPEKGVTVSENEQLNALEQELRYTRENLQATIEELQASNEELKSANEEQQSTNEELQSTNEELETSKEEMQSINEEMITVNAELQSKIEQLSQAEGDMKNLMDGIKVGTVFLDNELMIKRFTSESVKIIHLIPTDIGRSIAHFATNLESVDLAAEAQKVLETLEPDERAVRSKDGGYYLVRIIPYITIDNVIDGVVITFTDVTQIKKQAEELEKLAATEAALGYAEAIIETLREPLMVLDPSMHVISANSSFYELFQMNVGETVGRFLYELDHRQWDIPELRRLLEDVLSRDEIFENFEVDLNFEKTGRRRMLLNARRISHKGVSRSLILLAMEAMK
jgi:two-component system, chemotaxis family, CheB/CheR fusion protein